MINEPELVRKMHADPETSRLGVDFINRTAPYRYAYNFTWLGMPIVQLPPDLIAIQEIVWNVRPDLIVETGIAHGGSLVFHASLLELLGGDGEVVGVDIEIRPANRARIEAHPMFKRIRMLEGSSTDPAIVEKVCRVAEGRERVLVLLDSNHTHEHVRQELAAYSPLVKSGSYVIVSDTIIEDMAEDAFPDRPWGRGDNARTAVWEFMKTTDRFTIDKEIEARLLITGSPDGYLRCVKD
jgi:cephalosporin hydroxylase